MKMKNVFALFVASLSAVQSRRRSGFDVFSVKVGLMSYAAMDHSYSHVFTATPIKFYYLFFGYIFSFVFFFISDFTNVKS